VVMRDASVAIGRQGGGWEGAHWPVLATLLWGGVVMLLISGSMVQLVRKVIARVALPLVVTLAAALDRIEAPAATPAEPVVLQVQAGPFEPAANGGGAVVISSAPVKEDPDPLASELDALENTLARGKRAPAVVSRKDEKQRVLFELARRIEPDAPLTAVLLRQVVHDLERPA